MNDFLSVTPDTDDFSQAARKQREKPGEFTIDQLVHLYRQTPSTAAGSSSGTPSDGVFSSQSPSTGTKPTSSGSSYPLYNYNGSGKGVATYASSSLSAEHGSGSDSELEKEQNAALSFVGGWTADDPAVPRTLRRGENSRRRPRPNRRVKAKKPEVVVHNYADEVHHSSDEDAVCVVARPANRGTHPCPLPTRPAAAL
jgi:hypothetical protein